MKSVHLIGIGGAGMNIIAQFLLKKGIKVSGSDKNKSAVTERLRRKGAKVYIGHRGLNLPSDTRLVVYSSSIPPDNPELNEAHRRKLPVEHRAQFLRALTQKYRSLIVAGSHGKTTTTAMIALIFSQAGLDPAAFIGGELADVEASRLIGDGKYAIIEADESDGSFLYFSPDIALITNIDFEHMDYYRNLDDILDSYQEFISRIKRGGTLVANFDCPNTRRLSKKYRRRVVSYGLGKGGDYSANRIDLERDSSAFNVVFNKKSLGEIRLAVPGQHNVVNALGAIAAARVFDLKFDRVAESLANYRGCQRRFDIEGYAGDIMVVDDYAHHPAEIKATLGAARLWNRRIITVFQPHRYTRTHHLKQEFGGSFDLSDIAIFTDIYPASESPIKGVSGRDIYTAACRAGHKNCLFLKKEEIVSHLARVSLPGDMVLVLGAGDIEKLAGEFLNRLRVK